MLPKSWYHMVPPARIWSLGEPYWYDFGTVIFKYMSSITIECITTEKYLVLLHSGLNDNMPTGYGYSLIHLASNNQNEYWLRPLNVTVLLGSNEFNYNTSRSTVRHIGSINITNFLNNKLSFSFSLIPFIIYFTLKLKRKCYGHAYILFEKDLIIQGWSCKCCK